MKILFLTDNFPPEYNAPATRTYEHCVEWVRLGAEVTVITCAPNFPKGELFEGYSNKWKQTENMNGIRVIRVWSYISSNTGMIKRTLDFISFAITSFLAALRVDCDRIVATSPQFFTAISGCFVGMIRRKKWFMEVRDIWPESIKAVEAVRSNSIIAALERIELFLYRKADKVIVVTDSFKENLISRGVAASKIDVVKNGVDLKLYQPRAKDAELISSLGLKNKFVVGYLGTHGLAHSLDFIVRCASRVNDPAIQFLFIGDGAEKKNIVQLAARLKVTNVTFLEPVAKSEIPRYLSLLDIALVCLKKSTTFESVIPSKVFESVAMERPILLGVDGETRRIMETYGSGLFFEPENESSFLAKLTQLRSDLGTNPVPFLDGCKRMAHDYNRTTLAKKMFESISN